MPEPKKPVIMVTGTGGGLAIAGEKVGWMVSVGDS